MNVSELIKTALHNDKTIDELKASISELKGQLHEKEKQLAACKKNQDAYDDIDKYIRTVLTFHNYELNSTLYLPDIEYTSYLNSSTKIRVGGAEW